MLHRDYIKTLGQEEMEDLLPKMFIARDVVMEAITRDFETTDCLDADSAFQFLVRVIGEALEQCYSMTEEDFQRAYERSQEQ